jgi:hypothetical protein
VKLTGSIKKKSMKSVSTTFFPTFYLILTFLLDEINVGLTLYKLISYTMVTPTWISFNKRMSVKENVGKKMLLVFLKIYTWSRNHK